MRHFLWSVNSGMRGFGQVSFVFWVRNVLPCFGLTVQAGALLQHGSPCFSLQLTLALC